MKDDKLIGSYIQVDFTFVPDCEIEKDILSSLLCDDGFDSFIKDTNILSAFIPAEHFNESRLSQVLNQYGFKCSIRWKYTLIEATDWNRTWEANSFQPIIIGGKCVIHSTRHSDYPHLKYDIIINPKMSFGSGHHETTRLIASELLNGDIRSKEILDVGTGTGILAILCAKLGAKKVSAIEIDFSTYQNAEENIALNNVSNIVFPIHGDASSIPHKSLYDVIIANINRNIIIADLRSYVTALKPEGTILLSGFYDTDVELIAEEAGKYSMAIDYLRAENRWTLLNLRHK